ncbi:coiled-coil domain-containing protein 110 [Cyrtonyx montezumae]|uniref:coiled-coil domain-containing protein 110 n=1 Tax=Cyrtonyx montezumae TaxID=9017 RepID=UPI0032DA3DED
MQGWAGRTSHRAGPQRPRGTCCATVPSTPASKRSFSEISFPFAVNHTGEGEDPIHLQTALEILQQQLESFQKFQRQTLVNANMVQFEIHDILNKNIFEKKTPVHISAKIMMTARITCTASNASLTLLKIEDKKFSENKVAPEYDGEIKALHKPLKNCEHLQKRVHYLQNENLPLRNKVKHLADTDQYLKEKISKLDMKIKDLAKEKRSRQIQLVKSPQSNEECVKEVKNLLRKCKELQNQEIIFEKEKKHHKRNKDTIQAVRDFQIMNKKLEEKMTACEKGRLTVVLESLPHKQSNSQETNKTFEIKICQLTEEMSSIVKELKGYQSEIQQMKEKATATKSELETHLQLMQTLPKKKLNLEMTPQECSKIKQILPKDIEKVQSDNVYTEKKLMTELRNAKADIDLLKYNLSTANTEYKRLSTVVTDVSEENQLLKRELYEYRQYASKYENDIRKLTEECLLLENHLWRIENERDVLQLEFHHLLKDYVYLQGQATVLIWAQRKPNSSSGTM